MRYDGRVILHLHSPSPHRLSALEELLRNWPGLELRTSTTLAQLTETLLSGMTPLLVDLDAPPTAELAGLLSSHPHLLLLPAGMNGGAGALNRPLRWPVLAGRLYTLLDRSDEESAFAVGSLTCLPAEHLVIDGEGAELARLTDKEVALLRLLAGRADPVGRSELLERVWGYREDLDTHTLETHIYRLRQKIEPDPAAPRLLLTVDGGYKLGEG